MSTNVKQRRDKDMDRLQEKYQVSEVRPTPGSNDLGTRANKTKKKGGTSGVTVLGCTTIRTSTIRTRTSGPLVASHRGSNERSDPLVEKRAKMFTSLLEHTCHSQETFTNIIKTHHRFLFFKNSFVKKRDNSLPSSSRTLLILSSTATSQNHSQCRTIRADIRTPGYLRRVGLTRESSRRRQHLSPHITPCSP